MSKIRFFGAIMLLALIIQSGYFNLEKSLYADSAFYLYQIINDQILPVQHNRIAGALAAIPAYVANEMGFHPSKVFKLFAMGPWLILLLIFSLMIYLKRIVEPMVLVITLVWFTRESFFITTEVPLAMGFALLFQTALSASIFEISDRRKKIGVIISGMSAGAAILAHPYGVFFVGFFMLWAFLFKQQELKYLLKFVAIIAIGLAVKMIFFPSSGYEQSFLNVPLLSLQELRNSYSSFFFFNAYGGMYLLLVIIWVLSLFRLNTSEARIPFLITLLGVPLLWYYTLLVYAEGDANPMMEKSFMIIALPVVFIYIDRNVQLWKGISGFQFIAIWIVSVMSLGRLIKSGETYSTRLYHLDKEVTRLTHEGRGKFYIYDNQLKNEIWQVKWALPFESLLMSMKTEGVGKTTLIAIQPGEDEKLQPHRFHGPDFFYAPRVDSMNIKRFALDNMEWRKVE